MKKLVCIYLLFYRRFNFIEKIVQKNNQKIEDISLRELLNYWEKAKHEEK